MLQEKPITNYQFPIRETVPEETMSLKEFALLLDNNINPKTKLPRKYCAARRLLEKHGGFHVINDNRKYKVRVVTVRRAHEILALITVPPKQNRGRA